MPIFKSRPRRQQHTHSAHKSGRFPSSVLSMHHLRSMSPAFIVDDFRSFISHLPTYLLHLSPVPNYFETLFTRKKKKKEKKAKKNQIIPTKTIAIITFRLTNPLLLPDLMITHHLPRPRPPFSETKNSTITIGFSIMP